MKDEMLATCNEFLDDGDAVERSIVHELGLFHKTSHVWLYDDEGFVYFQVRTDADKLYTSASGHVLANETPQEAAIRETKEELGINIKEANLELIEVDRWEFDSETKHDHAFAHIFLYKLSVNFTEFKVDLSEVSMVVKLKAKDLLGYLLCLPFECEQFNIQNKKLKHNKDLLLMDGEISILKYGRILQAITKRTTHEKENIKS